MTGRDPERSLERLRRANPSPTRPVAGKPTAEAMLATAKGRRAGSRSVARPRPASGLLVATGAFAAVLAVASVSWWLITSADDKPVASTPGTVTAPPPSAPTTIPAAIDADTQALIDQFVALYNSGDVEAFIEFLHPEFERGVTRERSLEPVPRETLRVRLEIYSLFDPELSLECAPGLESVGCVATIFDDFHRVQEIAPTFDGTWYLSFKGGLLIGWDETIQNFPSSDYERLALEPFLEWVRENHFGVLPLRAASDWTVKPAITDTISALFDEWEESLGVDPGE